MSKLQKQIKEGSWYKQALNTKAYYIFSCCRAAMHCAEGKLGFWSLTNGKYLEAFLPHKNFVELAEKHLKLQKKEPKYIDRWMERCKKGSFQLERYYDKLASSNIRGMKLKEVQNLLKKLDELNYKYWCDAYLCDLYDPNGEEMLKEELEKEGVRLSEKELNILMKTNWKNYMQEEMLDLLKCYPKKELISEHAKKYFYINNSWESTTSLDEIYFREKLDEIKDGDGELKKLNKDWEKEHKWLQEKHKISTNLMNVLYYFRQLFVLRDQRKKHTLRTNHYYDALFKRIGEILEMPFKDFSVILVEEAVGNVGNIKDLISQRTALLLEVYTSKKSKILSGGRGVGCYNLLQKSYGQTGNLSGRGACKGKVEGVVRVILGETHFSKFNEGEIIVAPMTRPEYAPLMKKAAAVITDEGGITCHAAIISRELKIPCIVGTQKATSKLKDGMLVEVDANKGLVKVLRHLKIVTIQNLVDKEMERNSYLIPVLKEGLLNITAAAEKFMPSISQQVGKDVDVHAISMAIRRYAKKKFNSNIYK